MKQFRTERIHSLDSLRAIMMMLGVVLHSANNYVIADSAVWTIKDAQSTALYMDWISSFVHAFRMPIFFVVAGFFAALLFYERSSRKMLLNRVKRILLPFIVFLIILWPLVRIAFIYSINVFAGVDNAMSIALNEFSVFSAFIPERTIHLWFLYYLIYFSITSYVLGLLFKKLPRLTHLINKTFSYIIQRPIYKVVIFSAVTFIILFFMNKTWVDTSLSFIPDFKTYIFYAFFYFFGWILFKSKNHLNSFLTFDWLYSILATALFTLLFLMDTETMAIELVMLIKSVTVWLFTFGFTGLFIRYASKHSAIMRYVSDSSYWVYLMHLPLTALLPGLIGGFEAPAFVKFLIVMSGTAFICFATYHYLVRPTFIGKFLNGRKYTRKIKDIKMNEEKLPIMEVAQT